MCVCISYSEGSLRPFCVLSVLSGSTPGGLGTRMEKSRTDLSEIMR